MPPFPSVESLRAIGYPIAAGGSMPMPPPPRRPSGSAPLEDQFAALEAMTPAQRIAAMYRGDLSYPQLCRWAAAHPEQMAVVNGEFVFITAHLADVLDHEPAEARRAS